MDKFNKVLKIIVIVMLGAIIIYSVYMIGAKPTFRSHVPHHGSRCMSNLRLLYFSIRTYLQDNKRLPEKLTSEDEWATFLYPEYLEEPTVLRCYKDISLDDIEETSLKSSYRLNPELLGKTYDEVIEMKTWLVREFETYHEGKCAVCFTNGDVKLFKEKAENE